MKSDRKQPAAGAELRPLADRLRPAGFAEFVGQSHLFGSGGALGRMISSGRVSSTILWGPPGVGKTTVARLLAGISGQEFVQTSAVLAGVRELRAIFDRAGERFRNGQGTLLFVDEVHRFNRSQQDAFLPFMEDGTITLIGATTENPSFELNSALLSRASVLVLERLNAAELEEILERVETYLGGRLPATPEARGYVIDLADGDARILISLAEQLWLHGPAQAMERLEVEEVLSRRAAHYDKSGDWHYNLISALHKSVRSSDPDASLYWLARMLNAGEDPRFVARRVTRMASEDIGLADPGALAQCLAAWECYERLGSPEGELAIAQAVIHLALAPKSNAAYKAFSSARKAAAASGSMPPPKHILNAPTQLMKQIGYGEDYAYDHDSEDGFSGQNCFPESLPRAEYYFPVERGFEREMRKRLAYFARLRRKRQQA
ncbi:MAG: replication-associated recombination protein A [Rhodobacteraceae bacterium]|nr:replication-associated recombination protein A [Paracoccaceae bacterium]